MQKKVKFITQAAVLAAAYAALCHLQNLLFPNSASWAIQFRVAETLCILAFFTPSAIPGLTIGCLLFNVTSGAALPLDFFIGSLASLLSAAAMWLLRNVLVLRNTRLKGIPLLGLLMPALFNALLVGWELTIFFPDGYPFILNALYVAIGELAVLLVLGTALYCAIKKRGLDTRLFGL